MHKKEFAENGSILLEMNVECKIEHAKWVESLNLVPNGTKRASPRCFMEPKGSRRPWMNHLYLWG